MRLGGLRPRWWITAVVLLAVLGGAGLWLVLRDEAAATPPTTATATTETVKQTVSADGTLQAAQTAELDFAVSGTVTGVLVKPGDTVKKGQVLARVDDAALVATAEAAQASLDAAYSQLDTDQDAGASDVQIAADEAALLGAKADLADAAQAVEDAALRSTIDGAVAAVEVAKGDRAGSSSPAGADSDAAAKPAITVVSTGRFVVEANVAATDVERLKTGLQTEITVSGVDETVYGTVKNVDLVAQADDSGAAVFPVTIEVTGTRDDLYAGTSATVSIIVSQRTGVLTVPSRALTTEDGKTYVTRQVDGEDVRTEVTTGEAFGMSTEITKGLEEGDVVVLPTVRLPSGGGNREEMPEGFELPEGFQPPEGFTPGGDFGVRRGNIGGAP